RVVPGVMALTLMPRGASSTAMARVRERTAPLEALYAAWLGSPTMAALEETLMIFPLPCLIMMGTTTWLMKTTPITLTANMRCQASSVSSQKLPPLWTPLLFTRTSIRPQRAMTWSTVAWHSLLEETSVLKKTADPPAWVISSSTFLPVLSLISTMP